MGTTEQVTGLIPTVLAIGILNKTTEYAFGKSKKKPVKGFGLFKKK